MTAGGLTFLSWARTGLISKVAAPTGGGNRLDATMPEVATLPVTLTLAAGGSGQYDASLVGPGDVIGLDTRQIIRSDPAPGAVDAESNYFAIVEFDRPDLPWMLTPNQPAMATDPSNLTARRGLRPWICLVVVPDRTLAPPSVLRPLPCLSALASELPDLETSWLWAHAQVLTEAGDDLQDLLAGSPERTLSRLVCSRRLAPGERYLACVVPTFESGRRAGLGLPLDPSGVLTSAWTHDDDTRTIELPVYHSWRFSTSQTVGDFQHLAMRMQPTTMGGAGVRILDVGEAGSGLPVPAQGATAWELDLEGVIVGDEIEPGRWRAQWKESLRDAIALRLAGSEEELAPPTYGALQAGFSGAISNGKGPRWLRDLNLDPRYRATAALGTRIVQQYQEALMASAWEQSADIRAANRLLRQAQVARAVGGVIESRIAPVPNLPSDRLLQITRAIHNQIGATTVPHATTIAAAMTPNPGVRAALTLPFRRIARPRGPLARRLSATPFRAPVVRLGVISTNPTSLRPTPVLRAVSGTVGLGDVSSETFGTLTAARVVQPVFPWEPSAPAQPQKVPSGYLSDMVVTTQRRPAFEWDQQRTSAAIATALDFDGAPQLGWEEVAIPPVTAMGFGLWSRGYAASFVEFGNWRGLLSVGLNTWFAGKNAFSATVAWRPGFLLDTSPPTKSSESATVRGEEPRGLAVAGADVRNRGNLDTVVVWTNYSEWPLGNSMSHYASKTFLSIGKNFNKSTGAFSGGWTTPRELGEFEGPYSLAASGARTFLLIGTELRLETLATDGTATTSASIDLRSLLPDDYAGGAITVADFGGGTSADVLIYFVAGCGDALRAAYRIAYDVGEHGTVAYWGDIQPAPIGVAGSEVGVLLGPGAQSTIRRRTDKTAEFRAAAEATQSRQSRIFATAKPPAPPPGVDPTGLADDVRTGIDPAQTVTDSVSARLALAAPIDPATVGDPLQPLALTPRFPYPTYELFRDAFQDRLFPGASALPDDSVTALLVNRNALESFLVGLNHEMSRELLWRGFPLRYGTYFSQFWDATLDDIGPIEAWTVNSLLGAHSPEGAPIDTLLLLVRAELVRRIPDVIVYAAPARVGDSGSGRTVDLAGRVDPLFTGRLDPDIRFFGFPLTAVEAHGTGASDGWYFVFQEHPTAPRFGLNESTGAFGTRPERWIDLDWSQMARRASDPILYADTGRASTMRGVMLPDGGASTLSHRWAFSAAHMAHITLQRPVQVAIHGSDLLESPK